MNAKDSGSLVAHATAADAIQALPEGKALPSDDLVAALIMQRRSEQPNNDWEMKLSGVSVVRTETL